jgi:hypothetical protein
VVLSAQNARPHEWVKVFKAAARRPRTAAPLWIGVAKMRCVTPLMRRDLCCKFQERSRRSWQTKFYYTLDSPLSSRQEPRF